MALQEQSQHPKKTQNIEKQKFIQKSQALIKLLIQKQIKNQSNV